MTPEELSRIREIYEQVLPMSGAAREAHLDRECQGKEKIRQGVERLLKARENIPAWLDRPAVGAAEPFVAPELPKMEGRHFSGYTLIREIGRGGMGAVYLAERSDETFHRQAAIKLVLPLADSAAVIARFQQEREILASLDHSSLSARARPRSDWLRDRYPFGRASANQLLCFHRPTLNMPKPDGCGTPIRWVRTGLF